jgi:hypothetical protein
MCSRRTSALVTTLASGLVLAACSEDRTATAGDARPVSPPASGPTNDPCALTPDSDVRAVFADAKAGKRDHSLDKYDIATCTWDTPTNTFVVQIFKAAGSAHDEVRSRAAGVIDPVKRGAGDKFRYDAVAGVGDEATVLAEAGDPANGIFNDIAVFGVHKGDRMAVLFARSLIDGDRDATVKALEALGRKAVNRL